MSDNTTIATVAAQPEPIKPGTAAGLSIGKDMLIIVTGLIAIWTNFSRGGLTEAYAWVNSIDGLPFLSLVGVIAIMAWGSVRRWLNRKLSKDQREIIQTIANAPPHEAAETVAALRDATPAATPIPVTETKP